MRHFIVKSVVIGLLYIEGTRGSSSAFTEIENAVRGIDIGDATMYNIQDQNDRVQGVVRHFQQPAYHYRPMKQGTRLPQQRIADFARLFGNPGGFAAVKEATEIVPMHHSPAVVVEKPNEIVRRHHSPSEVVEANEIVAALPSWSALRGYGPIITGVAVAVATGAATYMLKNMMYNEEWAML